ncbi:hypothetical protein [Streptomyces hiroshimensis]|uniref:Uncharacterized protein n=1 Tax=Streptomyces hiroshimensis TaxID=66424 RepID=A0ABQ2Y625_9ACTN|nr:hypothetical protein [Streptomyces hiroshimensis]GGX65375.1 hypothetical protein GCM10010324_07980 [Streptomyces hiroshimensis]
MSAGTDRRWAELARELEFGQLPELRRQAEGWRTGLTGLTALFAVLVVLKGRDNLADLPVAARDAATGMLAAAFVLLAAGALLAVRAASGRPGDTIVLGGQALRDWTRREAVRVARSLVAASVCCVTGVLLVAGAVGVAWSATDAPPEHLVRVSTGAATACGELAESGARGTRIWTGAGDERTLRFVPAGPGTTVKPVAACP